MEIEINFVQQELSTDSKSLVAGFDRRVYKLYGLPEEERKIVEGV